MSYCQYEDSAEQCLWYREHFGFAAEGNRTVDQWKESRCANCKAGRDREIERSRIRPPTCTRCGGGICGARKKGRNREELFCRSCSARMREKKVRGRGRQE